MKIPILLYILLVYGFTLSKIVNPEQNVKIANSKRISLKITGVIKNQLQIDSIYNDIEAIPLETNNKCLISQIMKVIFVNNKLFIHDRENRLLIFDLTGKFLNEIGKQGRGPGEFLELRDFDIDKDGNIYILDFKKILKYNDKGAFIKGYPYQFSPEDLIKCSPYQFCIKNDGNFFIWGGSIGINENPKGDLCAMYEMNKTGQIKNRYFPLKYNLFPVSFFVFRKYNNLTLIDPVFGSNIIYSIQDNIVYERYLIDFGTKTLDIPVPEQFTSLGDFKTRVDNNYYHTIIEFNETEDWIYFCFFYKQQLYNVYYSKRLDRSFISKRQPMVLNRLVPGTTFSNLDNCFISFIDPKYVIEEIRKIKEKDQRYVLESEKRNMSKLENLNITDNPVLFKCTLKKY